MVHSKSRLHEFLVPEVSTVFDFRYRCGGYAQFLDESVDPPEKYDVTEIKCQWNKTWTRDALDRCVCECSLSLSPFHVVVIGICV